MNDVTNLELAFLKVLSFAHFICYSDGLLSESDPQAKIFDLTSASFAVVGTLSMYSLNV